MHPFNNGGAPMAPEAAAGEKTMMASRYQNNQVRYDAGWCLENLTLDDVEARLNVKGGAATSSGLARWRIIGSWTAAAPRKVASRHVLY